jgi:hypothetical protein
MPHQVFWTQAAVVLACSGVGLAFHGIGAAGAAAYGAGITLAQVLALFARARYARRIEAGAHGLLWIAVLSFIERIVLIAGLMLLGLAVLELKPAAMLLGLAAGQIGFLWAGAHYRLR